MMGFFEALTKHKGGHREPLNETTAVLAYEVGRMLEHSMYLKWYPEESSARLGFYKSELMDAIAQLVLICESLDVDFEEMRDLGIEKALERFTGKEEKR
ncbi:hypothetical protein LCGC14_0514540 [marine sediment metagenome]|uniref:NTP pyrophosphohydrolase MazG putative catalytic core domain-containing protein n=1 Tax=marine sediment metagenome TaxID=412755 RepID=A0A0F9S090_9ZZZZ